MSDTGQVVYIGSFPPPYGGVTVKNALLFKHLSKRVELEFVDLSKARKFDTRLILKLLHCLMSRRGALILGVSADWRRRLTDFLYYFNRGKLERSLLFVMGGKVPDDERYVCRMGRYKRMYVETESMRRLFEERGAGNVSVYPNCRERPRNPIEVKKCAGRGSMSSVFFSLISSDKGVRLVLDAADTLPQMSFHFYGRVEADFSDEFFSAVKAARNVEYHGVFDSVSGDALAELNRYDLHLFPTLCPNEGVPGVIVETKMAGVPTIASDRSYNAELVVDGVDGVLTHTDTSRELAGVLDSLMKRPDVINDMKAAALSSAESFYIDRYIDWLVADLSA